MTLTDPAKAAVLRPVSTEPLQTHADSTSGLKSIFIGPKGVRTGWRLLIFVALVVVLLGGFVLVRDGGLQGARDAQKHAREVIVTPWLMANSEAIALTLLCVATLVMAKIEHRGFGDYGLPLRQALRKDFWIGALSGFLAISGTLFAMFLLHGFRVVGLALHGTAILSALGGWGVAFLLAGLFEEFLCRGYMQFTLASGMGFWPAAFVMSAIFAFGHVFNPRETMVGVSAVVLFGLLHCLFLLRTGNLWLAVGFHAAWDWGQTFYGVSDSGIVPFHNLFSSAFSGPRWLTGGTVGPEASVLTPIALLIVALVFSHYHREDRYQIEDVRSTADRAL